MVRLTGMVSRYSGGVGRSRREQEIYVSETRRIVVACAVLLGIGKGSGIRVAGMVKL